MAEAKKKRKIYTSEIVWYSIFGALWLTGFVFAILGMFAYNYGKLSTNSLYALQKAFAAFFKMEGVMDFRLWGSLVMVVGMIGILIAIYSYSAKAVEEENKRRRYEERMRILMESDQEAK